MDLIIPGIFPMFNNTAYMLQLMWGVMNNLAFDGDSKLLMEF